MLVGSQSNYHTVHLNCFKSPDPGKGPVRHPARKICIHIAWRDDYYDTEA